MRAGSNAYEVGARQRVIAGLRVRSQLVSNLVVATSVNHCDTVDAVLRLDAPPEEPQESRQSERQQGESQDSPGPGEESDALLVGRVARGEREALSLLYDRYASLMLALGQRILGTRREAEDLLHDVFIEIWRKAEGYDETRGGVRSWMLLRMRSRALDRRRTEERSIVVLDSGSSPEPKSPAADPESAYVRAGIRRAVLSLPEDQRTVLELGYFEGLSSREIAERFDIPIGTVKSRVARGIAKLRDLLCDPSAGARE